MTSSTGHRAPSRALIEAELREQKETLETINRVGQMLAGELDIHKLVQAVTDAATELTGARFGSFFYNVLNEEGASYMLYTLSGVPREAFAHFPMPRATDLFGPTFRGEGVLRIADVKKDPRYGNNSPYYGMPEGHLPVTSYLAVPVVSRSGEVLGGLFFGHPDADVFTARHERLVVGLAAQAAVAIDNARLFDALRRSEGRVRRLVDSDVIGVVFATLSGGQITGANEHFLRMVGYTREELREGKVRWVEMTPPEFAPLDEEAIRQLRATGSARHYEKEYLRKDGTRVPILIGITMLEGSQEECVAFILDITERKRVEAELRASEQRYRALTDAMPQLVWATDADGSHVYYNRRWYEYTGLSEEESLGFGFTNALHPEDKQRTLARWERAWRTGEGYEIEYRFYSRPRGEYRWFLGRAMPLRDESGAIRQWVGTCTDIEEQKQMEETLERLNRERERMLEEVSTPLVPVLEGVLVLPIIGSLDNVRMQRATSTALDEVRRTGARVLIIDITGARIIDERAVANLSNLVAALRLVGAEAIVTGVTVAAAQALVGLGLDLGGLRTHRTLAQALVALINTDGRRRRQVRR
jgi:PAS domain S-box-containing protein